MYLIEFDSKDAAYHFSIEEYFTRFMKLLKPVLMVWQTDKTVMLGNNQVVLSEVDRDFAHSMGISIIRRSSGGGAIFTDTGTVLYTMIEPLLYDNKTHREQTADIIIDALKSLDIKAVQEGRNDILLNGKKISGLAQYSSGNHICTHGSLLYDTDLEVLTNVLIANENKLHPKGITSIRSRVTNIKPNISENLSIEDFIKKIKIELLRGKDFLEYEINENDHAMIRNIYKEKYSNENWNFRM